MAEPKPQPAEIAFYYPGHLWEAGDWIKTLLLFFDGIGLLVPEYKLHEPETIDPVLAGPLRDRNLLHYFVADEAVDKRATTELAKAVGDLLASGAFDALGNQGTAFHAISMSRLGYYGDSTLAKELFEELKARNLVRESEDGVSIPIHPLARYLILTLLAQILRSGNARPGLELFPATDRMEVVGALAEVLNIPQLPSAGNVVAFDLKAVSVNLATVPLDEVLAYRSENAAQHRRYARSVRSFARELSLLPLPDRTSAFRDRQAELSDLASDLENRAHKAWRRPTSFSLGLAGSFWAMASNPVGGLLSLAGLFAKGSDQSSDVGAFSYLFSASKKFANR